MEYAAGGELLHRIRKLQRLPRDEAVFYAAEIADALRYMHDEVRFDSLVDSSAIARPSDRRLGGDQPIPHAVVSKGLGSRPSSWTVGCAAALTVKGPAP